MDIYCLSMNNYWVMYRVVWHYEILSWENKSFLFVKFGFQVSDNGLWKYDTTSCNDYSPHCWIVWVHVNWPPLTWVEWEVTLVIDNGQYWKNCEYDLKKIEIYLNWHYMLPENAIKSSPSHTHKSKHHTDFIALRFTRLLYQNK